MGFGSSKSSLCVPTASPSLARCTVPRPAFYLFVGPNWKGDVPRGITKIFRASTHTGYVMPRVFQDDSPEDNKAVQSVSQEIMMYPLADYDGKMKSRDWSRLRHILSITAGEDEVKLIVPWRVFDIL